jgi:2-dehydro-3-deoxygluconokinase
MMQRIVCFGEMLLRIGAPGRDPLLRTPRLEGYVGGAEANVAVALANFGHASLMVTTLPDHALGDACIGELRRHGVDTSAIRRAPGRLGLYFLTPAALLRPPQVIYDRGGSAFACAAPASYDWPALLAGADWLHLSGITPAVSDTATRSLEAALSAAAALRVSVSFDCNYRPSLWRGREDQAGMILGRLARHAQLLFGGAADIASLFGQDFNAHPPAEGFALAARAAFEHCPGLQRLATTRRRAHTVDHHELQAYLADRDGVAQSRVYTLQPVADRVGAGDAFAAGVIHGLCAGLDRQRTVEFAAAASALKHGVSGDFSICSTAGVQQVLDTGGMDIQR